MRGRSEKTLCRLVVGVGLILAVTGAQTDTSAREVVLRSGASEAGRQDASAGEPLLPGALGQLLQPGKRLIN